MMTSRQEKRSNGATALNEMMEFASFTDGEQRYIRRSLDVGLGQSDAVKRWARNPSEADSIRVQAHVYRRIDEVRDRIPDNSELQAMAAFMAPLVAMTAFDLAQGRLTCFASYRFLYERLLGAAVRPWLVSASSAAALLPNIHPEQRYELMRSIGEADATAPGWSGREPAFLPEWIDEADPTMAA